MDIWKFGALLFTREVFAAGATSAYDLFFTDKTSAEKASELQKVLKDSIDNFENAGASVIGALIPIPGAADMIRGLVTSTAAENWETTLTTIAAENIVAAVRPLFHLAQGSAPGTKPPIISVNTQDIPPVKLKSETQNAAPSLAPEYQTPPPLAPLGLQSTYNTQNTPGFVERRNNAQPSAFPYSEAHPTDPLNPANPGPVVQAPKPTDAIRIQEPVTVNDIPTLPERNGGA